MLPNACRRMSLRSHGVRRYARLIEQNVAHVRHLAALVDADPALELLAPVALNVACFRYAPQGVPEDRLDALNREILLRLQERGIASAPGVDGELVADTTDLRAVGDAAHGAGLPVWELSAKAADLEALFLELTAGTNRNAGEGSA